MTFLDKILAVKREEVKLLQGKRRELLDEDFSKLPPCRGFARAIAESSHLALIAEVKRASPSKGLIAPHFDVASIAKTYQLGGAAAISVLTDVSFFQGGLDYLRLVHQLVSVPVLRKDFIIDELQIAEARQAGADAVLLICAALDRLRLMELSRYAKEIGLDVLVEVHSTAELEDALSASPSVLGVNNRDLHSFEVSLATTEEVLGQLPKGNLAIAESGIYGTDDARRMADCGARGILVGESLMRLQDEAEIVSRMRSLKVETVSSEEAARG